MDRVLIKNASYMGEEAKDILVVNSKIQKIATKIEDDEATIINGEGLCALPGLVDMQVHLREPGQEEKETIDSGTLSAARGGFTTVACMPNTNPTLDNVDLLATLHEKIKSHGHCKVIPVPAMTKGIRGSEVCDYESYAKVGITAITDDGRGVQDDSVMEEVFKEALKHKLSLLQHCEVESISKGESFHQGVKSKELGIEGQPGSAESEMVKRDLNLLEKIGGHYHVLHLSSGDSLNYVQEAKKKGLNATCEVTPHHLILCDEDIPGVDTYFKMNPPLRGKEDRERLHLGLIDGSIDFITTDHAPHTEEEKSKELSKAPFGIVGLETAFPLIYTDFVLGGKITLKRAIELMSSNPVSIFKLDNGGLEEGDFADITLVDLNTERIVDRNTFVSKGRNTPFHGRKLKGWPVLTLCEGTITFKDENYEL